MPVILFEGPDNSGKTTFARSLEELLAVDVPDLGTHYEHSPIKDTGWLPGHSSYLKDVAHATRHLRIQDRTPEVSESVYGTMRGEPRGRGWAYESYAWVQHQIFMVFCEGGDLGKENHTDVEGNKIGLSEHTISCMLYEQTYFNLRNLMLYSGTSDFRVVKYDRLVRGGWLKVVWELKHWLAYCFPERSNEIGRALGFSIDSAFPMPTEKE